MVTLLHDPLQFSLIPHLHIDFPLVPTMTLMFPATALVARP